MTLTKAPPLTEKAFQRQVVELAKIYGWRVYHPFLSKWSEKGFPDLTMVRARDRRLLFAELKTDKGAVSESQTEWLELLGAVVWPRCTCDGPMVTASGYVFADSTDPAHDTGCALVGGSYSGLVSRVEVHVWRPRDWDQVQATLR